MIGFTVVLEAGVLEKLRAEAMASGFLGKMGVGQGGRGVPCPHCPI